MIKYDPAAMLRKIAPESKIANALKSSLSVKKTALVNASLFDFLDTDAIASVAIKAAKSYKIRVAEDPDLKDELLDDPALLVQRVQNEVVYQVAQEIKSTYGGQRYTWTPSSADEPSPEHQLNYGKEFILGEGDANGEDPGDRYGCQCGMDIHVDDSSLDL